MGTMKGFKSLMSTGAVLIAVSAAGGSQAVAKDIVIGTNGLAVSMDPLFALDTASLDNNEHIYESLVTYDDDQNLKPLLAVSWKPIDNRTWEFKLRKGVKFHDGGELRAADAVASLKRAMKEVPGSSSPYTQFFSGVTEITAIGDLAFHVKTEKPAPLFPDELHYVSITPAHVAEQANNDDFNSGKLAIGTGPYKFKHFLPNNSIELTRNDGYWGGAEPWDNVIFRLIKNSGARVAALLSGDVDLINTVPPQDVSRLRADDSVAVWQKVSDRLIYLLMDQHRDVTLNVSAKDGSEVGNPFKNRKVRQAISYAVNQGVIVKNVMRGVALETNQPMAIGMPGYSTKIAANVDDLGRARSLLAEAGYPDGFKVTLHSPDGRYLNDAQVAQAVGQMLSRLGLDVRIETLPRQIFASRGNKLEYSIALYGFGLSSGPSMLRWLVHTRAKEKGWGGSNRGRYSNPTVDTLAEKVFGTFDEGKRVAMIEKASKTVVEDYGIVPLYHQVSVWATKADLSYEGRIDEKTLAKNVREN